LKLIKALLILEHRLLEFQLIQSIHIYHGSISQNTRKIESIKYPLIEELDENIVKKFDFYLEEQGYSLRGS
jgi:alkyl hydroperoxide reductase subunit AhpC